METQRGFLVGPDNGSLFLAAKNQGIECIHEITNSKFMLPHVSSTFHGRDIFAPAATYLDLGINPSEFGPEVSNVTEPTFSTVKKTKDAIVGEVLHVDGFGNVITNIPQKEVAQAKVVNVKLPKGLLKLALGKTYAAAAPKEAIALIGSHGFLEIALNQGNAAKKLHVKAGDTVEVTPT